MTRWYALLTVTSTLIASPSVHFEPRDSAVLAVTPAGSAYITNSSIQLSKSVTLNFEGSSPIRAELLGQLPYHTNYLIGLPSKWRTNVPQFERVRFSGVYPGIDLFYYGAGRNLEYDLKVAPQGRIEVDVSGRRREA